MEGGIKRRMERRRDGERKEGREKDLEGRIRDVY